MSPWHPSETTLKTEVVPANLTRVRVLCLTESGIVKHFESDE